MRWRREALQNDIDIAVNETYRPDPAERRGHSPLGFAGKEGHNAVPVFRPHFERSAFSLEPRTFDINTEGLNFRRRFGINRCRSVRVRAAEAGKGPRPGRVCQFFRAALPLRLSASAS